MSVVAVGRTEMQTKTLKGTRNTHAHVSLKRSKIKGKLRKSTSK